LSENFSSSSKILPRFPRPKCLKYFLPFIKLAIKLTSPWKGNFPSISCAAAQSVIENALQQFSYFSQLVVVLEEKKEKEKEITGDKGDIKSIYKCTYNMELDVVRLKISTSFHLTF